MKKLFEMPTVDVEVLVPAESIMTEEGSGAFNFGGLEDGAGYWN